MRKNYATAFDIYEEHVRIVESFRSGDVEVAAATLEENIN